MIKVKSVELAVAIHDPRCLGTTNQTDRSFAVDREPIGSYPQPGGARNEKIEIGYSASTNMLFLRGWRKNDAGEFVLTGDVVASSAINAHEIIFAQSPEFIWDEVKKTEPKK